MRLVLCKPYTFTMIFFTPRKCSSFVMGNVPFPQAKASGGRWQYYKFGMSQMHCSKVGDEPVGLECHKCTAKRLEMSNEQECLTMTQVDLIQMDDYPTDSCAISPTAFFLTINSVQLPSFFQLFVYIFKFN